MGKIDLLTLGADVAKLSDDTKDHVVLLVYRTLADDVSVVVPAELDGGLVGDGAAAGSVLLDFRELGEEEHDRHGDTGAGNGQVDELNVGEVVLGLAGEEGLGGDEGTNEGCH